MSLWSTVKSGLFDPETPQTLQEKKTKRTRNMIFGCAFIGLIGIVVFALHVVLPDGSWRGFAEAFGGIFLIACAFFGIGGLVGFLFGIPRSLQSQRPTDQAQRSNDRAPKAIDAGGSTETSHAGNITNTNLEQISDWLTKIIVGLGLVQLKQIPEYCKRLAAYFSADLDSAISQNVMLAIISFFFVCGFFLGYLMTRLYLQILFTLTDVEEANNRRRIDSLVENAGHQAANDPKIAEPKSDITGVIESQISTAQKIANIASPGQKNDLQQEVLNLAQEYDQVREALGASSERTARMEVIASKMRTLALASYSILDDLVKSSTAGERLAAIAFLEVKPKLEYVDWLAARVGTEKPFVGYHAALALRFAARTFGASDYDRVSKAIRDAKSALQTAPGYRPGTDRETVLSEAEKLLDATRASKEGE
jgi:hypothetical protein